jgi:ABC-type multidrug transport system ATPase subunit
MHALMGPSGSGKTTMLDMVALTRDTGIMTGTHYVNGVQSHSRMASFLRDWLQHNVSYVRQQDNLFPLLTVREHLTHAAWLMLPEFMSLEEKLERVNQVVKIMELDRAADTICGDGGVAVEGGISGGQRRRVSVATQLLRLPAALILDEPTSGLDSTNAFLLVKSLNMLAHQGGVNVIMTIHQPRREIYRYLDTLKILVAGRLIFQGAPKEAFDHFGVSARLNIGDEILDQLAKSQLEEIVAFQRKYEQGPLGQAVQRDMINEVSLEFDWSMAELIRQTLVANALAEGRWTWTESSSAPTLMYVLMSRTMKRGGFDVAKTIMISLFGGILVGIVFVGQITYTRKTALAYLSVATMTFLQGTFIGDRYWAEKFMYESEAEAGTARPWISFLGSMYARLFVSSTVESLAFAVPVYYLGFQHPDRVLMYLLIMTMVAVTTATQYLLVEIYFMKPDDKRTGALVNIALLSMSALFNGFIIQLKDLPVYLAWCVGMQRSAGARALTPRPTGCPR